VLLSEFLAENQFDDDEAFLAAFPHPFLLEEGVLFAGGRSSSERLVFPLDPANQLVIGRKTAADIRVRDPSVSGRHAQLFPPAKESGDWLLADLGSTNGTFVNGTRLEPNARHVLLDQAVLGIGPSRSFVFLSALTFRHLHAGGAAETPLPASSRRPTEPMDLSRERVTSRSPETTAATPESEPGPDEAGGTLYLCCEGYPPTVIEPGQPVIIGRSAREADFVLPHPAVSRRHAELLYLEDGVHVRDLGSANGVILDGLEIGDEAVKVPLGAKMRISDFTIVLRAEPGERDTTFAMDRKAMKRMMEMDLDEMPLPALLKTLERKVKSGTLKVIGDGIEGDVAFQAGKPYLAETSDGLRGAVAIERLLAVRWGKVMIDPNERELGEREISESFCEIIERATGE
jgi:pSer/pThr/pTyr-binding forkhead associated (FHA) protein